MHSFTTLFVYLRNRSTIPLSLVTSHHLINYKADLENLIFSNASHSFLIGEGTLITYDFKGIENDFADRLILNKLSIEDDLKVDNSEGKFCNIIKRLQLNIPQVSLYLYFFRIIIIRPLCHYTPVLYVSSKFIKSSLNN